mgnify:CR=1 FL=1
MKKSKLLQAVLGVILAGAPLFAATTVIKSAVNDKNVSAGYSKDSIELNRIVDVINIIETNFVGTKTNKNDKGEKTAENVATPSKEELYKGAVEGVVRKLDDPYSEYLSTEDLKDFTEDMDGEYTGVGMSVSKKKGEPLEVVSPFIGSPAEKVGIKPKDKITYHIFDIIDYELPYIKRRNFIDSIENTEYQQICEVLYKGQINNVVFKLLDEVVAQKQEGLMANDIEGMYESKRVKSILKFKKFNTVDLKCISVEQGEKKYANTLGAIVCEYKGNIVKVGSGFTDSQRDYYWNNQDEIIGRVVEIQYFEETQDKQGNFSLRFGVFLEIRHDKNEGSYE